MDRFELDWEGAARAAALFIQERTQAAGRSRGVIGLSGGIDSSVSAYLAARALGPSRLHAVLLPHATSSEQSHADAMDVVRDLDVPHELIDITPMVDAYFERYPDAERLRRANMMARQRMAVLYDQSERLDALVVGTGNLTEALLGYTTMWGDMACAFNPIGDLYKTQVRRMAAHLGVPAQIIAKPPTADLWHGQTDEGELGFTYDEVDRLLHCVVDRGMTDKDVVAQGFELEFMDRVRRLIRGSRHKRRLPVVAPFPA